MYIYEKEKLFAIILNLQTKSFPILFPRGRPKVLSYMQCSVITDDEKYFTDDSWYKPVIYDTVPFTLKNPMITHL